MNKPRSARKHTATYPEIPAQGGFGKGKAK